MMKISKLNLSLDIHVKQFFLFSTIHALELSMHTGMASRTQENGVVKTKKKNRI